jgi:hypothetical protein
MFAYFVLRKGHALFRGKALWDASDENRGFGGGDGDGKEEKKKTR